jgi:hypothetical protein
VDAASGGGGGGDDGFWDRKVEVPADADHQQPGLIGKPLEQPAGAMVATPTPAGGGQPGLAQSIQLPADSAAAGAGNDLARLFASMKTTGQPSAASGTTVPAPVVAMVAAAAPAATAAAAQPVLLTPQQLMQQEAAGSPADGGAACGGNAGTVLLQSLLKGTQQAPQPSALEPAPSMPSAKSVDLTGQRSVLRVSA